MTATEVQLPGWPFAAGDEVTSLLVAWARLGGGRRCETWLCWSRDLFAPVAVKLGRPSTTTQPKTASTLETEAANVRALAHPAFQRLYDCRTTASIPHLVFEYVEGPSLASLLATESALPLADAIAIGEQLAWALAHLHAHELVHLDMKPGNILLRDGRPVIVDLGSTRPTGLHVRAATDMHMLGIVLFELVHGRRPADEHDLVSNSRVSSSCFRFDELFRGLLGDEPSRPDAVGTAARLGELALEVGSAPCCQI